MTQRANGVLSTVADRVMNKSTLYLPSDVQRRLRSLAKATGRPQAELIREALEQYLARAGRPLPSSIAAGGDDDVHARDTVEWLGMNWKP